MPHLHVYVAEHQRRLHDHEELLSCCRQTVAHSRALCRQAPTPSRDAFEYVRMLKHTLDEPPAVARSFADRPKLLCLMARLDQAEAAANEILLADGGARADVLAELIASVAEDAHASLAELLDRA